MRCKTRRAAFEMLKLPLTSGSRYLLTRQKVAWMLVAILGIGLAGALARQLFNINFGARFIIIAACVWIAIGSKFNRRIDTRRAYK
jgi:hypothetical protein